MSQVGDERRARARRIALIGGTIVGAAGVAGGAYAGVRAARVGRQLASFAWRTATFQLHRRCPDCFSRIDGRARVCRYCGHRMKSAPS